jgi:uncharacterized Zn finger protein
VSWQDPQGHLGTNLPPPADGISVIGHELGRVGQRWEALIKQATPESHDRLLRGRTFAKRGRVRALHVSPGVATAEVVAKEIFHPSLRVRPFKQTEWAILTKALLKDLDTIACLLDGELPGAFMAKMDKKGAALMPAFDELSFDCDCGDYIMPCAHVSTVFQVLTHALDGEPFLLLTLRGRTRDHLMSTLRSGWGDEGSISVVEHAIEESPPEIDWYTSPCDIPDFPCSFSHKVPPAAGLRAIGPPPGEADLLAALQPLYERGGEAAMEVIASVPDREPSRRRSRSPVRTAPVEPEVTSAPPPPPEPAPEVKPLPSKKAVVVEPRTTVAPAAQRAAPPRIAPADLTEALVNLLAEIDDPSSGGLARALGVPLSDVRRELLELEELGLVYQDREGPTPTWRLG